MTLVPKSAILSARTTTLAPHLPPAILFHPDSSSGLLLSLIVLHELLVGARGPWWGFIQSFPRLQGGDSGGRDSRRWGIPLPLAWARESGQWAWLRGTEAGRIVERAERDRAGLIEGLGMSLPRLEAYFHRTVLPLLAPLHPGVRIGLDDFVGAHSLVSSRSFVVDMYHNTALVPLSDMFNHAEQANIHFEADDDVCDECGALGACPHCDDPLTAADYGRASAMLPAESGPNSVGWQPPIDALRGVDTVDMVAQSHIETGDEAFNSYGMLSNAALLTTYGFCLEDETAFERYGWEWRDAHERAELVDALGLPGGSTVPDRKAGKRSLISIAREDEQGSSKRARGAASHDGRKTSGRETSKADEKEAREAGERETNGDDEGRGGAGEDGEQKAVEDFGARKEWATLCAQYADRPLSMFAELYQNPVQVLVAAQTAEGDDVPLLRLPHPSPFALLASEPVALPVTEQSPDHTSVLTEELLAAPGTFDGCKDATQPFFIDETGRVSLGLWRAALLSVCLSASLSSAHQHGIRQLVARIESTCDESRRAAEDDDARLFRAALDRLSALVGHRRARMHICANQEEALDIIEVCFCFRTWGWERRSVD